MTGFLVPARAGGEEPIVEPDDDTESEDVRPAGEGSRRLSVLPASIGLSVVVPPGEGGEVIVVLRGAEYAPFWAEGVKKTTRSHWLRVAHPPYRRGTVRYPAGGFAGSRVL